MGKTLNREQRKNSKYIYRDVERELKELYSMTEYTKSEDRRPKQKNRNGGRILK